MKGTMIVMLFVSGEFPSCLMRLLTLTWVSLKGPLQKDTRGMQELLITAVPLLYNAYMLYMYPLYILSSRKGGYEFLTIGMMGA